MNESTEQAEPWYGRGTRPERAARAAAALDVDALVALTPENAEYLSGVRDYIAAHWRVPALSAAVVGRDGERALVTNDYLAASLGGRGLPVFAFGAWIEHLDLRGTEGGVRERIAAARPEGAIVRPAQYDLEEVYDRVAEAVRSVVATPRRLGVDLATVTPATVVGIWKRLPGVELVDASAAFADLRAVKDEDEIGRLRLAAELTDAGIAGAVGGLRRGQTERQVNAAYQIAVLERAAGDPRFDAFRQAEGVASVGIGPDQPGIVDAGRTVKFDMQVDVGGYHSDVGRTYALAPTEEQRAVHAALLGALREAQGAVRPGVAFADIFAVGILAMRAAGFVSYSRGHLGHSVGLAHNFEEPPFIAADEPRPLVAGMVISLELPYYLIGIGAFQMERMLLVTDDGHETLDRLPFELDVMA